MADTYVDLITRIADESRRPRASFGTQIEACIQEAIDEYSKVRFPWNQVRSNTFSTVIGQEFYSSSDASWIDDVLEFDEVTLTVSSTDKRQLCQVGFSQIESWNTHGTSTGEPTDFAYWGEQIRLYPIPDAVYSIRVAGLFGLTRLSADADENAWTQRTRGEKLIRCRASAIFYGTYLREMERAAAFQGEADNEFDRLIASLSRRQATGEIRPSL